MHEDQPTALEAARKHFESALKLDPNYAPALAGLSHVEGYYYRDIDSNPAYLQRAEQLARQALAIDPQMPEAHIAMARVYGVTFRYPESISELRLAVQEEPDNALAWDMLSWALGYETPPDPVESEKAAREAIRLNPALSYAQYHIGRALYLQGRFPEAMAAFDRCEELSGNSNAANLGRSQALAAQGKYSEATTTLLKNGTLQEQHQQLLAKFVLRWKRRKRESSRHFAGVSEFGFHDFAALDANPAFSSLRSDARFTAIVARAKQSAPAPSQLK